MGHRWRLGGAGISEVALGDFPGIFGWNSPQVIFPGQKSPGDSRMDIFRRMFHHFSEKNVFFFRGDHFKKRILKRLAKMDFHLEAPISPVFGKQYQTMRSWPTEPLNQLVDDNYNEI